VLESECSQRGVSYKRPPDLRVDYLASQQLPKSLTCPNDAYISLTQPAVHDFTGLRAVQGLLGRARIRADAYEGKQCLPRQGNYLFCIKSSFQPRAAGGVMR
jgi:hypothetical protein